MHLIDLQEQIDLYKGKGFNTLSYVANIFSYSLCFFFFLSFKFIEFFLTP